MTVRAIIAKRHNSNLHHRKLDKVTDYPKVMMMICRARSLFRMSLRKEIERLERRVETLEARDEESMKAAMLEAMSIYLENEVNFSMSVEGQIKEILTCD